MIMIMTDPDRVAFVRISACISVSFHSPIHANFNANLPPECLQCRNVSIRRIRKGGTGAPVARTVALGTVDNCVRSIAINVSLGHRLGYNSSTWGEFPQYV